MTPTAKRIVMDISREELLRLLNEGQDRKYATEPPTRRFSLGGCLTALFLLAMAGG